MKKFLATLLTTTMVLSLAACGGDTAAKPTPAVPAPTATTPAVDPATEPAEGITMITHEVGGIKISLPDDILPQDSEDGNFYFLGTGSDTVSVSPVQKVTDTVDMVTKEVLTPIYEKQMTDVTIEDLDNTVVINGGAAAVALVSGVTEAGTTKNIFHIFYFPEPGSLSAIVLMFDADSGDSLAQNAAAIMESIMPA